MGNTRSFKNPQHSIMVKHGEILLSFFILFFVCLHVVLSSSVAKKSFLMEKCEKEFPECECELIGVTELICQNVSDFDHFTGKLSDGSVFKINTTLVLRFSGNRVFPPRFLKGLVLERLYIDDIRTEEMEDGALEGIFKLKEFNIELSSIEDIPDFRPVSASLRTLNLDNSRLTSISGDRLKNLPALEKISFVNNSIQSIASDAFEGTDNVIIFDVSHNQLKSLPRNLFNSWKKLNEVVLSANNLLHVDQLFSVANPSMIFLDHNNLTDLDSIFYPQMDRARYVRLSHNPLARITDNSFNGKINKVNSIFMDNCLISEFNASHFKQLSRLWTLDLSNNLIEKVANPATRFGVRIALSFANNKIKVFDVSFAYSVDRIDLAKNQLTSFPRFLQYSQVLEALLYENRIESLGPDDFRGVLGIETIELQDNLISKVDPLTFKGIRKDLEQLDLSRNKIRSLQGCFKDLSSLTVLVLTGNMIESFEEGEFQGMAKLLDLYLDGNFISSLGNEIKLPDQLQILNIENNRISNLKPEQIPQALKNLYLEGNPFKCNCQLLSFLQFLNSSSITADKPLCTPSSQTSQLPPSRCPEGCSCYCTQDHPILSVDCSSSERTQLPPVFTTEYCSTAKENCSSMSIYLSRSTQFSESGPFLIEDEIGYLDLSHNFLKSLEGAHLPVGMQLLLLDNNDLQVPPLPQLLSLKHPTQVSLSGNPWKCDCELVSFKDWILNKLEIVFDANETRCGPQNPELSGHVIWSLINQNVCPVETGSYATLVIGLLSSLLVIAVVVILLSVYWSTVRVWLLRHVITCFQDHGTIQSKEFENYNLLHTNGQENSQRNNFPLPVDLQQHPDGLAVLRNSDSLFQERPVCRPVDEHVSISPRSQLPM